MNLPSTYSLPWQIDKRVPNRDTRLYFIHPQTSLQTGLQMAEQCGKRTPLSFFRSFVNDRNDQRF